MKNLVVSGLILLMVWCARCEYSAGESDSQARQSIDVASTETYGVIEAPLSLGGSAIQNWASQQLLNKKCDVVVSLLEGIYDIKCLSLPSIIGKEYCLAEIVGCLLDQKGVVNSMDPPPAELSIDWTSTVNLSGPLVYGYFLQNGTALTPWGNMSGWGCQQTDNKTLHCESSIGKNLTVIFNIAYGNNGKIDWLCGWKSTVNAAPLQIKINGQAIAWKIIDNGQGGCNVQFQSPTGYSYCYCSSGQCCDGCQYNSSLIKCETQIAYSCNGSCGGYLQSQQVDRFCNGQSSGCNGAQTVGALKQIKKCASDEKCISASAICQKDSSCLSCVPSCSGKQCGDNGCGSVCGTCSSLYTCQNGQCVLPANTSSKCKVTLDWSGNYFTSATLYGWATAIPWGKLWNCQKSNSSSMHCEGELATSTDIYINIQFSGSTASWLCQGANTTTGTLSIASNGATLNWKAESNGQGGCNIHFTAPSSCSSSSSTTEPNVCTPVCSGKKCGDNGCGGVCGTCSIGYNCQNSQCVATVNVNPYVWMSASQGKSDDTLYEYGSGFTPNNSAKLCFIYPNGGTDCSTTVTTNNNGYYDHSYQVTASTAVGAYSYYAIDVKSGKQSSNTVKFTVVCTPSCSGKACGASDGCSGTCASGYCASGQTCQNGQCVTTVVVNPSVSVSPTIATPGTTLNEPVSGCTPNGSVKLCFIYPSGTTDCNTIKQADSQGKVAYTYTVPGSFTCGVYKYYAIDLASGKQSNTVSFTLINPTVSVNPTTAYAGTTLNEPGSCLSPNSTATLCFKYPSGTTDCATTKITGADGSYTHSYIVKTTTSKGVYQYYAKDGPSGVVSNTTTFTVK